MIKKVIILAISLCFCIGCAPKEIIKPLPNKTTKDFNKVELFINQDNDTSSWDSFAKEKDKYDDAMIRIIEYTREGAPITKTLIKGKANYTLSIDNSKDEYREDGPAIETRTYQYLHRVPGSKLAQHDERHVVCFKEDPKDKDYWYLSDKNHDDITFLNSNFPHSDSYLLLITKRLVP